jgi:UDP-N-acetylglucosamine--N-acetylmuramyl-(pentapeptide) pyrophosphoryl-undecaprenol N-acetylglucosamine transferase
MKPKTILFQPPNHIGLGHISRLIAVALAARESAPSLRLPFVVDGHGHGLIEAHQFPCISLPTGFDAQEASSWSAWPRAERRVVALDLALSLVKALAPDLIVFDCFPNGAMLNAALERRVAIAICLRKAKEMRVYYEPLQALASAVRLILIAHDEGECQVPAPLRSRTRFTGPIARRPCLSRPDERDAPAGPLVVITAGGGGYPGSVDFYNLALAAFATARQCRPELNGVLVTGPLFTEWWRLRLVDGMRVLPFDPRLTETFARASLVVCQGGYNTVTEIRSLGVPALCVPAERAIDDQFERARSAADASPSFRTYSGVDVEAFAVLLLESLRAARTVAAPLQVTSGAAVAASYLMNVLESASTPAR